MPNRRTLLAGLSFAAIALAACGGATDTSWGKTASEEDVPGGEKQRCTVQVAVPNMACETACPIKVHQLLSRVEGVEHVDVSFETRQATVTAVWPACGQDGYRKMLQSLATKGYEGQVVSSE